MKQTFNLMFILILLITYSCNNDDGRQDDTIKFATDKIIFDKNGGSKSVPTDGDEWFVTAIEIDGEMIYLENPSEKKYFDLSLGSFYIKRIYKEISIFADENNSEARKIMRIFVSDRNYHTMISIMQTH